ncbi:MAG TPA: putative lipid II flippase FtsW [Eubacteriaceae bacterium]|nr:putative lipid II flippase FtsW [Eubacteriaceae bacterium]
MKKNYPMDFWLLFAVIALTSLGVIMVLSASIYNASGTYNDQFYVFRRQFLFALMGIVALLIISRIDYKMYKRFAFALLLLSIMALGLVFVPGIRYYANGAYRWIQIAGITIQPAEIVKVTLILFMAASLANIKDGVRRFFSGYLPYLLLVGIISLLIYFQPNLSMIVLIGGIAVAMLFAAGGNIIHLMGTAGALVSVAAYAMFFTDWRKDRLDVFLNPGSDVSQAGWQAQQSILALGSGGVFGQGLGNGKQKMYFLPEPQNDFIFAHMGEEVGLIGLLIVLALFILVLWRGIVISLQAPDDFGALTAFGITFMIGMQVIINVAVVTQLIPVTGIPLPFVSAGGTSLLILMASVGILLNISKHIPTKRR